MGVRVLKLRYAGKCSSCSGAVPAGATAQYDSASRAVTCQDCVARSASSEGLHPDPGTAGASARREFARRSARREQRIRQAHPRLGGLILALTDEPQSTRAFAQGGAGESRLGRLLDKAAAAGDVFVLHDRKIAKPRGQVDHIAIGPAGVYVIDAKNYTGKVHLRSDGPFGLGAKQLYVGRRDCSKLALAMPKQVAAVRVALAGLDEAVGVEVIPVLAFVDAEWPLLFPPDVFAGVRIEGESAAKIVRADGPLSAHTRGQLAHRLAARLPAA
jgi:hypothetical protein